MENNRLTLTITGESMSPIIQSDDKLLVDLAVKEFSLGDILLFKDTQNQELTVHRLVNAKSFITKGDNSYCFDGENRNIIGKVISVNGFSLDRPSLNVIMAYLSRYSNSHNPLRYFFRKTIKWFSILFIIQKKSYLKDS